MHNSQPWRFRVGHRTIEVHADPRRHLAATDADGRDQVISRGAALHHLRVALPAVGWLPLTTGCPTRPIPATWHPWNPYPAT
ncbi:MAG TPA: hypothetical protein VFV67_01535 [Actinophytocola sp.]|uniref:hypothetical protein n=1 Tax=Actinophytocola sp. TaxID=1872138 RepID=UPI002DBE51FD|nr:hypothetical protein [Actinophytocola sp.]HEU5469306.1 hypothetical protein [Actinophytocola sp.]